MDATTTSLAIGLIVSLLFTELFGLAAGGMIVPGYFALYLDQPANIVLTLFCALATYAVVHYLAKHMIIYGRRRIVLMLLFGFLIGSALRYTVGSGEVWPDNGDNCLCVIGFIVPGLVALWFDRQGVTETLGSLFTSSVVVRLTLILIGTELM